MGHRSASLSWSRSWGWSPPPISRSVSPWAPTCAPGSSSPSGCSSTSFIAGRGGGHESPSLQRLGHLGHPAGGGADHLLEPFGMLVDRAQCLGVSKPAARKILRQLLTTAPGGLGL